MKNFRQLYAVDFLINRTEKDINSFIFSDIWDQYYDNFVFTVNASNKLALFIKYNRYMKVTAMKYG